MCKKVSFFGFIQNTFLKKRSELKPKYKPFNLDKVQHQKPFPVDSASQRLITNVHSLGIVDMYFNM